MTSAFAFVRHQANLLPSRHGGAAGSSNSVSIGYCRSRTPTTAACKNVNFTLASHVLCYVKCYVKFRPRAAGAVKLTPRVKLTRVNVKLKLRNLASHRTLNLRIYHSDQ